MSKTRPEGGWDASGTGELIAGFNARDRKLSGEFFVCVMRLVKKFAEKRHPGMPHRLDEIESRSMTLLVEWRHQKPLPEDESLPHLAGRLVKEAGRQELRGEKAESEAVAQLASVPAERAPGPEDRLVAVDLYVAIEQQIAALPERYAAAMRAWLAELHGGPPIAEALGVEPPMARKLLFVARARLGRLVRELGIELPEGLGGEAAGGET